MTAGIATDLDCQTIGEISSTLQGNVVTKPSDALGSTRIQTAPVQVARAYLSSISKLGVAANSLCSSYDILDTKAGAGQQFGEGFSCWTLLLEMKEGEFWKMSKTRKFRKMIDSVGMFRLYYTSLEGNRRVYIFLEKKGKRGEAVVEKWVSEDGNRKSNRNGCACHLPLFLDFETRYTKL